MWYSGIDQHKPYCLITTYGPDGPRVKQARVPSSPLALQRYFAAFPGAHRAVVESTGAWYWLADALAALGVELVLAHATRLQAIAAAKVKTDQVDSDTLALLRRADLIPGAHIIAPAQRGPRDLMRARLRLVEKCVSAQNSIDRLLPGRGQLGWPHPAPLGLQGGQSLPQARHQSRGPARGPVLSGDSGLLPSQGPAEADPDRAHPRRARARAHRVSGAHDPGGLQRPVQEPAAQADETAAVATPGKPTVPN